MNQIFLITSEGDRHEDHIPLGFFDYEGLQREFELVVTEEEISQVYRWKKCFDINDVPYYVIPVKENRWIPRT